MKGMMIFTAAALIVGSAGLAQTIWNTGTGQEWVPQPATSAYPVCSRAKNDDRCIQLYERGTRSAKNIALNNNAASNAYTGQGGPYEPVDENEMNKVGDTAYTGQGGPYEPIETAPTGWPFQTSRSGYPPCPHSHAADNCIQLYERGVTGSGN